MIAPKIVRKVDSDGRGIACWLNVRGELRGLYITPTYDDAERQAYHRDGGWPMSAGIAKAYGTTLAALRAELEGVRDA